VLLDEPPRVQVGEVEVLELRTELTADVVARALGPSAEVVQCPGRLLGQARQPLGTDEEEREQREDDELTTVDPEHRCPLVAPVPDSGHRPGGRSAVVRGG